MTEREQTSRTSRRLAIDTGWPPPELLVMVTITGGTRSASSSRIFSSSRMSKLPLKGALCAPFRYRPVERSRAV